LPIQFRSECSRELLPCVAEIAYSLWSVRHLMLAPFVRDNLSGIHLCKSF
jgi:hypothetical protein